MTSKPKLTKNQQMVFKVLKKHKRPLSVYDILNVLPSVSAPQTVYRALHSLLELNLVHRIESLNAFCVCRHEDEYHEHENHAACGFLICDRCKSVAEITLDKISANLANKAAHENFAVNNMYIEMQGLCQRCETQANNNH